MKPVIPAALSVLLVACGSSTVTITGSLLEESAATHVVVDPGDATIPISGSDFSLDGLRGDTIDLRFVREEASVGWMRIIGLPRGARLTLHDVWFEGERAFPTTVGLDGRTVIEINGLRMASPDRLPDRIAVDGTVLYMARAGDALLVRPEDRGLPDLRVVLVPATTLRSVDGDPAQGDGLEFGDSVRVEGRSESGYVIASELTVPRRAGARVETGTDRTDGPEPVARSSEETQPTPRSEPAVGDSRGRGPPIGRPGPGRARARGRGN